MEKSIKNIWNNSIKKVAFAIQDSHLRNVGSFIHDGIGWSGTPYACIDDEHLFYQQIHRQLCEDRTIYIQDLLQTEIENVR